MCNLEAKNTPAPRTQEEPKGVIILMPQCTVRINAERKSAFDIIHPTGRTYRLQCSNVSAGRTLASVFR